MSTKHDDILHAARDLIFEHGLQSVSMSQIAKAAGVGMGTIYNYFPSKEDLINSLFSRLAEALSDGALAGYDAQASIPDQLMQLCRNLICYGIQHPHDMLLFEQFNHSPYIRSEVQAHDYGVKAVFFTLIEEARHNNLIKELPPVLPGNVQISYVAAIIRSKLLNGIELDDDDVVERATEAWYDLLKLA